MKIFVGNSNPELGQKICHKLGIELGKMEVNRFSDGEVNVELLENVRGSNVFIVQSTCSPANERLMELVMMIDALKRSSATTITAVIPYFGYARQDRRIRSSRVPISAKVVADMICNVGVARVLTVDLHAEQIQGFFSIPVDNIYASPLFVDDIQKQNYDNLIIVSPDIGGVVRARAVAKALDVDLAIVDKRRPAKNVSEVMNVIGNVKNRTCIVIDDIVDTAGTLCRAATKLKEFGAKKVIAYSTHAVFSGNAIDNIKQSDLDEMVSSNSIVISDLASKCDKIRQLPLENLLAEAMRRMCNSESLSAMFTT